MATNISGSVSLVYGSHSHSENFSTTASTLIYSNKSHEYAAGAAIALDEGAALDVGTIDSHEGLLLVKNNNNIGALSISVDGSAYDISIPAKVPNLISVGPDHPVSVKCPNADINGKGITSASPAGVITLDDAATIGTAYMTGASNTSDTSTYIVEFNTTTTGLAYELDGKTKKDLSSVYSATTTVNLQYFVKYRYTLTEA